MWLWLSFSDVLEGVTAFLLWAALGGAVRSTPLMARLFVWRMSSGVATRTAPHAATQPASQCQELADDVLCARPSAATHLATDSGVLALGFVCAHHHAHTACGAMALNALRSPSSPPPLFVLLVPGCRHSRHREGRAKRVAEGKGAIP